MENNATSKKGFSFFRIIKKNLLLITLIIIFVSLLGTLLGIVRAKPEYKVSRSVILRTELDSSSTETKETNNAALAFLVIGQLEYDFTSAEYIKIANEKYLQSNPNAKDKISAGNIAIEYKQDSLIFTLSYKDTDKEVAIEKLKAVYEASGDFYQTYSSSYNIKLIPTDNAGTEDSRFAVSVSNSLSKYIIIGVLAGVVIAVAVVLIKNSLDNTVHDKTELEEITETNVLAYIDKR